MREAGKGSKPRPFSVAQEQYEARWDLIFGRDRVTGRETPKKEEQEEKKEEQPEETTK